MKMKIGGVILFWAAWALSAHTGDYTSLAAALVPCTALIFGDQM